MKNSFYNLSIFKVRRNVLLNEIENILLEQPNKNISIVGYPGTGKGQIIKSIINIWEEEVRFNKTIFIEISINRISNEKDFLFKLVEYVFQVYENKFSSDVNIEKHYNKLITLQNKAGEDIWIPLCISTERFFNLISKLGLKIICILYQFDSAKTSFSDGKYYNALAGFTNTNKVKFITTSRRSIKDIEQFLKGTTVDFSETFASQEVVNSHLTDVELKLFYEELKSSNVELPENLLNIISYYSGNCPKLLNQCCDYFFENTDILNHDNEILIKIFERNAFNFNKAFLNELDKLNERELYINLCLQLEERSHFNSDKVDKLLEHRVILQASNGTYKSYSDYFQRYLEITTEKLKNNIKHKNNIYISFSNKDKIFLEKLLQAFVPLVRQNLVEIYSRDSIIQGIVSDQINSFINRATTVFIICSSDYAADHLDELDLIKTFQGKYIPILYRMVDLDLIGLNDIATFPTDGSWLNSVSEAQLDNEIAKIVETIRFNTK